MVKSYGILGRNGLNIREYDFDIRMNINISKANIWNVENEYGFFVKNGIREWIWILCYSNILYSTPILSSYVDCEI